MRPDLKEALDRLKSATDELIWASGWDASMFHLHGKGSQQWKEAREKFEAAREENYEAQKAIETILRKFEETEAE